MMMAVEQQYTPNTKNRYFQITVEDCTPNSRTEKPSAGDSGEGEEVVSELGHGESWNLM